MAVAAAASAAPVCFNHRVRVIALFGTAFGAVTRAALSDSPAGAGSIAHLGITIGAVAGAVFHCILAGAFCAAAVIMIAVTFGKYRSCQYQCQGC